MQADPPSAQDAGN